MSPKTLSALEADNIKSNPFNGETKGKHKEYRSKELVQRGAKC